MRSARDWFQHLLGMTGQVAAVLPQILIAVFLARRDSLEAAGLFTVATGLAAAAFTVAAWGFVPHMVLERIDRHPAATYVAALGIALLVVGLATFGAGLVVFPAIGWTIVLAVIAMRAADAVIELHFGFAQVWFGGERAIRLHAGLHVCKLVLLAVLIGASGLWPAHSPDVVIVAGAIAAFAGASAALLTRRRVWSRGEGASGGVSRLFGQASWYGIAAVLCAVVTNLPRMSLPLAYKGEALGVAGVSLTIATFFGMAFYTAWVRHFVRLATVRNPTHVVAFLWELALLAGMCVLGAFWPLPQLAAWLFQFDILRFGGEVRGILLAAVAFFAGMSLVNLHKLGHRPWAESLVYLYTIAFGSVIGITVFSWTGLILPMLAAGGLMAALSFPAWRTALATARRELKHG